jgi:phage-related minor tail protein
METTIGFATKVGSAEKQISNFSEQMARMEERFSQISKYDDDMRKFSSAIKWLAGNRWDELREALLNDDFET